MLDSFELDLEGLDEGNLEGRGRVAPGKYHVEVLDVNEDHDSRTPCLVFKLGVLAGTVEGVAGGTMYERLYLSEKARTRVALFARRLGLIGPSDFGQRKTINWADAISRQAVVEVVEEEFTKKDGTKSKSSKLAFAGIFDVNDPRVADVPKDQGALKQPAKPPKPADDSFDDL
jgi:hypothetical protein